MRNLIFCVIIFFLFPFSNIFANQQNVKLFINGDEVKNLPVAPVIINDSVVVPVREVLEEFDVILDWKQDSRELFITKDDVIVLLKVNEKIANVNGKGKILVAAPTIINDKLMVPVRFIGETFGFKVSWDNQDKKVVIDSKVVIKKEIVNIISIDENDEYSYTIKADAKIDSIKEYYLPGNRLAIDIKNAEMKMSKSEIIPGNQVVYKIRVAQNQILPVEITRVVFDLFNNTDYDVKLSGDKFSIDITFNKTVSLCKNISCDNNIIVLKKEVYMPNANEILEIDEYYNKKYVLKFPMQIENIYGNGKFFIRNEYFSYVEIRSDSVIVNENKIWAYNIFEDNENVYVKAILPKEKYQNVFVIDAGHGGSDPGAINNEVMEKDLTFDIVKKVLDMFDGDENIKVYSTRMADVKIPLDVRYQIANDIGDMFISVHINSSDKNRDANGTEVFYYPHESDLQKKFTSKMLAQTLHKNLLNELESFDRKVKTENYVVLKKAVVPAALCEIGFITNPEEFSNLCDEGYRFKVANAIYNSVQYLLQS